MQETIASALQQEMFTRTYADVFTGDERWRELETPEGELFAWDPDSTYVRLPPYFEGMSPEPGTVEHATLVGKLAFFTALGIPDNGIFDTPIRDFDPLFFRGKQSKSGWSSCGSCHPDGLADGVTWSFGTGPRQTKPLDGMFGKDINLDQGILNWSAVRGSNTDFNANSRATQGGCGFATTGDFVGASPVDPAAGCISAESPRLHDRR